MSVPSPPPIAPSLDAPSPQAQPAGSADPSPARRGRPVTFDEARRHAFCEFVRLGCTVSKAAGLIGISRRGVLYAAKRDPDFAEQIRLARLESRLDPVRKIASSKSWQAAAWLLERNSRHWRLPPRPSAAQQAAKLVRSKRLRRHIRRMVKKALADVLPLACNEK